MERKWYPRKKTEDEEMDDEVVLENAIHACARIDKKMASHEPAAALENLLTFFLFPFSLFFFCLVFLFFAYSLLLKTLSFSHKVEVAELKLWLERSRPSDGKEDFAFRRLAMNGSTDPHFPSENLTLVELLPRVVGVSDYLERLLLIDGLFVECEHVQRLAVRRLVPPKPLSDPAHRTRKICVDVFDILELIGKRIVG